MPAQNSVRRKKDDLPFIVIFSVYGIFLVVLKRDFGTRKTKLIINLMQLYSSMKSEMKLKVLEH